MASITAADIKRVREITGAGMTDVKAALVEADGDQEQAVDALRKKGAAKAVKRGAERTASNGIVATAGQALIELANAGSEERSILESLSNHVATRGVALESPQLEAGV